MRRGLLLSLLCGLLVGTGCPSEEEAIALADQDEGIKAPAADLDSLAAMRATSNGGALEEELQQARSVNAQQAYATREDEPTLDEVAAPRAQPGEQRFELAAGSNAGSAAPSDLDTLDDGPAEPWINMEVVEQKIRSRDRSMKSCWDTHGPGGPGRVEMSMTIGAGGRAKSVKLAANSPVRDADVADCLARALRNIKYPEPRHGSVSFVYPVKF
jgi:hypothetical protein